MSEELNSNSGIIERDEKGRLQKGVILNPEGRPKGSKNFTKIVEEALRKIATTDKGEKIEIERALGEKVVKMALEGNEQMIKLIWNYKDGMPSQNVNISNVDDLRKEFFDKLDELNQENSKDNFQE